MIDLHMHLNGSLPAEFVIKLAKKHKVDLPTYDKEELKRLISVPLDCDSLNEYLKCTKIPRLVTQTKEGITDAVSMLLDSLVRTVSVHLLSKTAPSSIPKSIPAKTPSANATVRNSTITENSANTPSPPSCTLQDSTANLKCSMTAKADIPA